MTVFKNAARALIGVLLGMGVATQAQTPPENTVQFSDAILQQWVQAEYPPSAKKAKLEGEVLVEFVVETDGRVTQAGVKESSDTQFDAAAVSAVQQWVFRSALEEGQPVASGMVAPVKFTAAQWKQAHAPVYPPPELMPRVETTTPAKAIVAPDPEYPPELEEKKLRGEVQIEFTVNAEGQVREPHVLWASHAAFVETALRAVEKTRFEPAHQGLVPKPSAKKYPVSFQSVAAGRPAILEANGLTVIDSNPPEVIPQPFVLTDPVYPHARLLADESGSAAAEFTVANNGRVTDVVLTAASQPEFGAALRAAVESWGFEPGVQNGVQKGARMRVVHKFVPPSAGSDARLLLLVREGGGGVLGPSGLEARLKPLWRGFPVYPATLLAERPVGEAEVEFIIDRGGRVRLPLVKSATRDEFGWAAATAINQWVFEPPRRNGETVDVRVSIQIDFKPPTD